MHLRNILVFYSFWLCTYTSVFADEKFQLNGLLIPSWESLSPRDPQVSNLFYPRFSYGFGFEMKYFMSPRISTNIGLQLNNRGFEARPTYSYYEDSIEAKISVSCLYLSLPFDISFNFQPAFRTELYFYSGISYGILLSQSFKGQRVPEELGRPNNYLFEGVDNKPNNINWFDKNYVGLRVGIGASRYIKSRLVLSINPSYHFQIDKLLNANGPVLPITINNNGATVPYSPGFRGASFELKIGYYFNDQIENTNKKL